MPLLGEKDANYLRKTFSEELLSNVKLLVFVDDSSACEYCDTTQQILEELAELSEKIETTVYNVKTDKATAEMYKVEMTPAIVILNNSGKDTGIRFYGIPSGHEFSSLVQDIVMVSSENVPFFNEDLSKKIRSINTPVKIRVFVTPSCPYCPKAVIEAHGAAILNENITAEMIEANEFPELSMKYGVSSVPHTVINERHSFVGAYPEAAFVSELLKALGGM